MKKNERIDIIDQLRGLSCLGVLLYHIRVDLWTGWWNIKFHPENYSSFEKFAAWLSIPTPFMGYAILLFFIISGFCIHYPNTLPGARPCWKNYFRRRFWRIYPTYFIAILFTTIISFYCHQKWGDRTWDPSKILRVATVSQNYPPNAGQFLSNPSLWTIPLEFEFYILYPLAFTFMGRLQLSLLIPIALIFSGISIFLAEQGLQWISFTSLFLWPSWLLGALIAYLHRENKLKSVKLFQSLILLIIFFVLSLFSRLHNWDMWMQYGSWTGFYFFLFVAVLRSENLIKFKENFIFRALAWLGKISFSLYLIHFPLFKLLGYLYLETYGEKPANFLVTLLYLIPVIFVAGLFFKYVEHPIHVWSKNRKVTQ